MSDILEQFRNNIDTIDEKILALLSERARVVEKVAEYKKENFPDSFPIRSGREASMLRRILKNSADSTFSATAAAQIWRIIIGTSTSIEAALNISVFAPNQQNDLFWLAREYFGPSANISREPHIKRVIGAVIDKKAAIGIVPDIKNSSDDSWWLSLIQSKPNSPKIFAHLPMVIEEDKNNYLPCSGFAFARLNPEESGDDCSLYVLEVKHNVSQNRLQGLLSADNINARWLGIAGGTTEIRHHLLEISGFLSENSASLKNFYKQIGSDLLASHFLGAYARPFSIKQRSSNIDKHDK